MKWCINVDNKLICNCYSQCGCEQVVSTEGRDCDDCFSNHAPTIGENMADELEGKLEQLFELASKISKDGISGWATEVHCLAVDIQEGINALRNGVKSA